MVYSLRSVFICITVLFLDETDISNCVKLRSPAPLRALMARLEKKIHKNHETENIWSYLQENLHITSCVFAGWQSLTRLRHGGCVGICEMHEMFAWELWHVWGGQPVTNIKCPLPLTASSSSSGHHQPPPALLQSPITKPDSSQRNRWSRNVLTSHLEPGDIWRNPFWTCGQLVSVICVWKHLNSPLW